jgi:hypothetical protein
MSVDRLDWTVAPTLAWAAGLLCAALLVLDGDLAAIGDRLVRRDDADATRPVSGPGFLPQGEGAVDDEVANGDDPALTGDPDQPPPIQVAGIGDGKAAATGPRAKQPVEDVCLEPSGAGCRRWALDGFYAAIAGSERGRLRAPVRITWFGDSVSATDLLPGRLRERMQAMYGDGGPGFVHAVQPHRFMDSKAFTRTTTGRWATYTLSTIPSPDSLYGLGGSTTEAQGTGNKIRFKSRTTSGALSRVELYYLAQPRGGTAEIVVDGQVTATVDTAAEAKDARFHAVDVPEGVHAVEVRVGAGKVRLFGVALERAAGVVVDNLALVSNSAKNMLNNRADHWAAQLAHRGSDLAIVMLGSNDSNWLPAGKKAMAEYQTLYESMLAPLRKSRPTAGCLVIAPLDQAEDRDGKLVGRAVIPMMVDAQRRAAHAQGCAFWNTFAWMGGRGSAIRWNRRGLLGADFHHLSVRGSAMVADGLVDALLAGYGQYQAR